MSLSKISESFRKICASINSTNGGYQENRYTLNAETSKRFRLEKHWVGQFEAILQYYGSVGNHVEPLDITVNVWMLDHFLGIISGMLAINPCFKVRHLTVRELVTSKDASSNLYNSYTEAIPVNTITIAQSKIGKELYTKMLSICKSALTELNLSAIK